MKKNLSFVLFLLFAIGIHAEAQIITTIAGNGTAGFSGDGGPATAAELNYPIAIAVDGAHNVYISDGNSLRIRKVNTSGIILCADDKEILKNRDNY